MLFGRLCEGHDRAGRLALKRKGVAHGLAPLNVFTGGAPFGRPRRHGEDGPSVAELRPASTGLHTAPQKRTLLVDRPGPLAGSRAVTTATPQSGDRRGASGGAGHRRRASIGSHTRRVLVLFSQRQCLRHGPGDPWASRPGRSAGRPPLAGKAVLVAVQAVPVARLTRARGGQADHPGGGAVEKSDVVPERHRSGPGTGGERPREETGEAGHDEQWPPCSPPKAPATHRSVVAVPHAREAALEAERPFAGLLGFPAVSDALSPSGVCHAGASSTPPI